MSISLPAADRGASATFSLSRRGQESLSGGFSGVLGEQASSIDRGPGFVETPIDGPPGRRDPVVDGLPVRRAPVADGLPVERDGTKNPGAPLPDDDTVDPMMLLTHRLALSMLNIPAFSGVPVEPSAKG